MSVHACRLSLRYYVPIRCLHNTSSYYASSDQRQRYVPAPPSVVTDDEIEEIASFLLKWKKLFVITGAGISTESGIRDYRSDGIGLYSVSKDRPMSHQEFISCGNARQRYWARNYVGWPIFSSFKPNVAHHCLQRLERLGLINWLVTQNVDRLHFKAGAKNVTELHGASSRVKCLNCQSEISRDELQIKLDAINENFTAHSIEQTPDGDVSLSSDEVKLFKMIDCSSCGGILKPDVVFFGDNVSKDIKDLLYNKLEESSGLLVIGSSLQVFSSYRFALAASKFGLPIGVVNIGPTRADHLTTLKISGRCSDVLSRSLQIIEGH